MSIDGSTNTAKAVTESQAYITLICWHADLSNITKANTQVVYSLKPGPRGLFKGENIKLNYGTFISMRK